jgi:hypothetical protein
VLACLRVRLGPTPLHAPIAVRLTRVSPRALDGHDNLASAFKAVVDAIAEYYGVDDATLRVTYDQRRGKVRERGIVVAIERLAEPARGPR